MYLLYTALVAGHPNHASDPRDINAKGFPWSSRARAVVSPPKLVTAATVDGRGPRPQRFHS